MNARKYARRAIALPVVTAISMGAASGIASASPASWVAPVDVSRIAYVSDVASGVDPSDERIARALERIATELERAQAAVPADQRDNPRAIRDALLRHSPQRLDPVGVAACLAALGEFLVTTGIPAAKIIKIIRDAKRIYGSLTQAIKAIKTNADAATLGEESVTVLQKIIGIDGVIAKCSGI